MGCILFSGAYFTPKAGMVGFLLLLNDRDGRFPCEGGQREQLHPTRREPIHYLEYLKCF